MRFALLLVLIFAAAAEAQERPRPEIKAIAGWIGFLDEDMVDHAIAGGAVRMYLTRHFAIEPELLYLRGPGSDRDVTLIPHITFDFLTRERVRPYVIGGVGLMHSSYKIGPTGYSYNDWVGNGGVGVKFFLTPRVFVAPEFRMGFETIFRAAGSIGFAF